MKKQKEAKNQKRKPYSTPKLIDYGSVREMTKSVSTGTMTDPGAAPRNMRNCIAAVSSLDEHRFLLVDKTSQMMFQKAIFETVEPGDVVLDLGTGSGIHAFFACQAGAKKVYALDSEPIIEIVREVAQANGFADRIELVYGLSTEIELPEKVDVIISNIGFLNSLEMLPNARRFLKKNGKMIPSELQISFGPVEAKDFYTDAINSWLEPKFKFDFSAFRKFSANHPHVEHFSKEDFLAEAADLAPFKISQEERMQYSWEVQYKVKKDGTFSGLDGWYSFKLTDKTSMSTKPPLKLSSEIWKHPFLPLSSPVKVKKGDVIKAKIQLYQQTTFDQPIWKWDVEVNGEKFSQSTFDSIPLSKELLKKLS